MAASFVDASERLSTSASASAPVKLIIFAANDEVLKGQMSPSKPLSARLSTKLGHRWSKPRRPATSQGCGIRNFSIKKLVLYQPTSLGSCR
jgi:hypothetical protein